MKRTLHSLFVAVGAIVAGCQGSASTGGRGEDPAAGRDAEVEAPPARASETKSNAEPKAPERGAADREGQPKCNLSVALVPEYAEVAGWSDVWPVVFGEHDREVPADVEAWCRGATCEDGALQARVVELGDAPGDLMAGIAAVAKGGKVRVWTGQAVAERRIGCRPEVTASQRRGPTWSSASFAIAEPEVHPGHGNGSKCDPFGTESCRVECIPATSRIWTDLVVRDSDGQAFVVRRQLYSQESATVPDTDPVNRLRPDEDLVLHRLARSWCGCARSTVTASGGAV